MTIQPISSVVIVACLIAVTSFGQDPVWFNTYGNDQSIGLNRGFDLEADPAGNLYGVGTISSSSLDFDGQIATTLGTSDVLLAKWDSSGNTLWVKTAGGDDPLIGSDYDSGRLVEFDPISNNLSVCGEFSTNPAYFGTFTLHGANGINQRDLFVASYNGAGDIRWVMSSEGFDVWQTAMIIDDASNTFVFGEAHFFGITFNDSLEQPLVSLPTGGFVAKYSATGDLVYAERAMENGFIKDADWINSSEWIIAGVAEPGAALWGQSINVQSAVSDGFVSRVDTMGTVQWTTQFTSSNEVQVCDVGLAADGSILSLGWFFEDLFLPNDTLTSVPGVRSFFLSSLDNNGGLQWTKQISSPDLVFAYNLAIEGDFVYLNGIFNRMLTVGDDTLVAKTSRDGFIIKVDQQGTMLSGWNFGKVRSMAMASVLPTSGGVYLSCYFDSTLNIGSISIDVSNLGWPDIFLAKFDSVTGFTTIMENRSMSHGELFIFANPNNGICTVELPAGVHLSSAMRLSVYDVQGQLVQQVPMDRIDELTIDISAEARGMYHVQLLDGTKKYSGTFVFK